MQSFPKVSSTPAPMELLTNPLAAPAQLNARSSRPLPPDLFDIVLYKIQCLTQAAGMLLDLPQSTTAQANVILARYWLTETPMAHELMHASAAALYLVAKTGAIQRSIRDFSNVFGFLKSAPQRQDDGKLSDEPYMYYQNEDEYLRFQNSLLATEAQILLKLSFDTHVALPHPLAITYLQALDFFGMSKETIGQRTVEYLNTSLLSPQLLYLTHQPHALATAAIYCAVKDLGARAPDCAWWEVFDVDREELGFLVVGMRSLQSWADAQKEETPFLMAQRVLTRDHVSSVLAQRGS